METEETNNLGRPEKPVNWDLVETMIHAGCTEKAICHRLKIDKKTFIKKFREKYKEDFTTYSTANVSVGAENILLTQYLKALKGNTQLLILLGKERCGQGGVNDKLITSPNEEYLKLQHEYIQLKYEFEKLKNEIQS